MILFQLNLVLSGNLSFLNWLTIVPALACLDDGFWSKILPRQLVKKAEVAAAKCMPPSKSTTRITWFVVIVICILSIQPIGNMMSSRQVMNTAFDPLDLVNTYGAFGSVGQERLNVVFEGTLDDDSSERAQWKPYIYKGLPVELGKRPPQVAPYQLRFDWQMWFASMYSPDDYPWTFHLVWKLLHNDKKTAGLFSTNPFKDQPPKYIRAVLYQYRFERRGNTKKRWWNREKKGLWMRPMNLNDRELIGVLRSMGWMQ